MYSELGAIDPAEPKTGVEITSQNNCTIFLNFGDLLSTPGAPHSVCLLEKVGLAAGRTAASKSGEDGDGPEFVSIMDQNPFAAIGYGEFAPSPVANGQAHPNSREAG